MTELRKIALTVAADARRLRTEQATQALAAGTSSDDVKLAILIASAFCMYLYRTVDGLKANTFADPKMYEILRFSLLRWDTAWDDFGRRPPSEPSGSLLRRLCRPPALARAFVVRVQLQAG
jgi:hypothetical protein